MQYSSNRTPAPARAPLPRGTAVDAPRPAPIMRRVEILSLGTNGDILDERRLVPSLPAFEDAFAAFARGALFPTERGTVAVEDLLPGDRVRTVDDGFQPILWKGSTMVVPGARGQDPAMGHLTRIAADARRDRRTARSGT